MSFYTWTDDLTVGNPALDDQHKLLIDLINRYHDSLEQNGARSALLASFRAIAEFAIRHFRDEEAQMARCAYPQIERHKMIHKQLLDRVGTLGQQLAAGEAGIENQIQFFLKNWLTAHIKGIDQQYTPYMSGKARAAA